MRLAEKAGEAIAEEDDRKLFLEEFAKEPWFGI
jgi:hypothetical protein